VLAPLSWLKDFAPFDHPVAELSEALSNLGLVVEGVTEIGGGLDGVEVVRILDIRRHPNADRIRLVDVDRGDGQALQIACGATNMAVGDLVPLATVGTLLPGAPEPIARRKMRGEVSNGMLCSRVELGLGDDGVDGLAILPPEVAPLGTPIAEALAITPDVVFDLDITPNRPDALSMAGIARDLAAALGLPFSIPASTTPVDQTVVAAADVAVEDFELCPRLTGTVIMGVSVGPSPAWLAERLVRAGMRPINNVVDVSNYVMLALGQPNHAYDLDRLAGRALVARPARSGQTLVTLDGVTRTLTPADVVIADGEERAIGVGGIMGGADTEISTTTTNVMLEAAYFTPMAIARTGKRLGINSEARARFERGIDPEIAPAAVELFVSLLASTQPDRPLRRGATLDVRQRGPHHLELPVRTARVNHVLGMSLDDDEVAALLRPLGFEVAAVGDALSVTVPTWRPDVTREIDVIEEVARLYGYRRIARRVPSAPRTAAGLTPLQRQRRQVREILVGAGITEAWTTTFLAPGDLARAGLPDQAVEVENPLDRSESILRTSLLPGLLKSVRFNVDRQQPDVRLFEIGRTFALPEGDQVVPVETETLAIVVAGDGADGRLASRMWALLARALRLADVELQAVEVAGLHPTRSARILGAPTGDAGEGGPAPHGPSRPVLGALGEVDPAVSGAYGVPGRVGWLQVDLVPLLAEARRSRQAQPISRFPASDVDLAFLVDERVPAAAVERTLRSFGPQVVEQVGLFDVYRSPQLGSEQRSLAYRLRLRAPDRTLTESELAEWRQAAIDAVVSAHGAELRS
jgi:phenylalanyl-tRNA synthetase beta chain